VIAEGDLDLLKDGAVLCNGGHFPREIAVAALAGSPRVIRQEPTADGITTFHLDDGRCFHLLTDGHMVNLAGPHPLGNSIESMDLGFALQARCLEAVAGGAVDARHVVVPVPRAIDEAVANGFLEAYRGAGPVDSRTTSEV
jgi:adenosylhomocysteinase